MGQPAGMMEKFFLLKIKSFRTFTQMWPLSFLATQFKQLPNRFVIFHGGVILKVINTMRQIVFFKGHEITPSSPLVRGMILNS
jgi:hypothetical protein